MTIRKEDALGRQPVNVRRCDPGRLVAPEIPVTHVIGKDEQDIGRLIPFGFFLSSDGGWQQCRYRQDSCCYFRERLHHS